MSESAITLPKRSEAKPEECWDLSSLFESAKQWEASLKKWEKMIAGYARFKGETRPLAQNAGGPIAV